MATPRNDLVENGLESLRKVYMSKFQNFIDLLNQKLRDAEQIDKITLINTCKQIHSKIEEHFNLLNQQNPQNEVKFDRDCDEMLKRLTIHSNLINKELNIAIKDAKQFKSNLESELFNVEILFESFQKDVNNNYQNTRSEEFDEPDALVIHDHENLDCDDFSSISDRNVADKNKHTLEKKYREIEDLTNTPLSLDLIQSEFKAGRCFKNFIQTVSPNFLQEFLPKKEIEISDFQMQTQLSQNLSFICSHECIIILACNINRNLAENFDHHNLLIEILDPEKSFVSFNLKQKIKPDQYLLRFNFTPELSGIYTLIIQFKTEHIPGSPFSFNVLDNKLTRIKEEPKFFPENLGSSLNKPLNGPPMQNTKSYTHRNVAQQLEERLNNKPIGITSSVSQNECAKISIGRGRLLSLIEKNRKNMTLATNGAAKIQHEPYIPQKRKSPKCSLTSNSNMEDIETDIEMDLEMSDLSRKLKKMVYVNETENQYHNYSQTSLSSINSINVITDEQEIMSNSTYEKINSQNILSDHLKKHSSNNGLIRPLMGNNRFPLIDLSIIPPVRAVFERKFTNCSFPIGVRCEKSRNWLIVCDSSSNSIKIFNNLDGRLIHQIDENRDEYRGKFTLKRPSAVLINNDDDKSEIYVKDDKEIFVFDLKRNFEFTRKFGFQILRRPYGLAYDSQMNLVLIDADIRNPLVYIFNKYTGRVISSKPYQPILPTFAQPQSLIKRFGDSGVVGKKPILGSNISNFEKTKVRFIYCNQDYLFASDLGRSIVYKTNLNGEIELAFGHFGKKVGEFFEPSGIHVENDGNAILVGDSKNDRLQIYDSQGVFKCNIEFSDEKPIRPSDFHVDTDGYLYVSNFMQKCVKKYKLVSP